MKLLSKKCSVIVALVAIGGIFSLVMFARAAGITDNKTVTMAATVPETMSVVCANPGTLALVTVGTAVTQTAACTATTNAAAGFNLKVAKSTVGNDATKTLKHTDGTTWIIDTGTGLVAYDGTTATPAPWAAGTTKGLGFRVGVAATLPNANSLNPPAAYLLWGNDGVTAEFAAFPIANQTIYNYASYSSASSAVSIDYKLDVPSTQKSGSYSGTVVYTATTN